jgi:hypothetical protein
MIWVNSMSLAQLELLENTFAVLTKDGWEIPAWLVCMRASKEKEPTP